MTRRRSTRLVAAIVMLLLCGASYPGAADATDPTYEWARQDLPSGTNGVDGYIRLQQLPGFAAPDRHSLAWINLCRNEPMTCGPWLQVGQYQGYVGDGNCGLPDHCVVSLSTVKSYVERLSACESEYAVRDLGSPGGNEAYYIRWAGATASIYCNGARTTMYKYEVFKDTLGAPVYSDYMPRSYGFPTASTETAYLSPPRIVTGVNRFGHNNAGQPVAGYGLHLYTHATGSWNLWTHGATYTGTYMNPPGTTPLTYHEAEEYWAFWTQG